MEMLITAAVLGLSLNYFMCIFMSFGMSSIDMKLALKFIAGRLFGLVTLGFLISAFGSVVHISSKVMVLLFGIMCMFFGIWLLIKKGCMPHPNMGLGLGFFRGMTPCVKIFLVIPLVYGSSMVEAVLIMLAFGLSSSIYPIIGILFGETIRKVSSNIDSSTDAHKSQCSTCASSCNSNGMQDSSCDTKVNQYQRKTGAVILIAMGIYYIIKTLLAH